MCDVRNKQFNYFFKFFVAEVIPVNSGRNVGI
jgi:hypothetical protein